MHDSPLRKSQAGKDQRCVYDLIVHVAALEKQSVIAQHFSVIGREDHERVFEVHFL